VAVVATAVGLDSLPGFGVLADAGAQTPSGSRSAASALARATAATSPAFLTVILGRALYSKGASCQVPPGMMNIDQVVPQLASMGITATAAVVPSRTLETTTNCAQGDLYPSWADLGALRDNYGLTVVSATEHHDNLPTLPLDQQFQDSCGSLVPIIAHGNHRAWGLLAYPNNEYTTTVQTSVVENCFAFGRTYVDVNTTSPQTNVEASMADPWLQLTVDAGGGLCNDHTRPCGQSGSIGSPWRYASPAKLAAMTHVVGGDWTALQFYSFVTGANTSGTLQWDCTSPDWTQHWTSIFETYCWNDFVTAMSQLPSSVVVTDPATVAEAWGRIPSPLVSIDAVNPPSDSGPADSTAISWQSPENGTYAVLVGGVDCNSGAAVDTGQYASESTDLTVTVPGSMLSPGPNTIRVCLTNDAGHTGSATTAVTLQSQLPAVTGVSPAAGALAGGAGITVTGANFTPDATVSFGTIAAVNVSVDSSTSITATVPAATVPAQVDVTVTESAGTSATSPADQFFYEDCPSVTSVSPSTAWVTGGSQVTVAGTNFYPDAAVTVGGQPATNVVVDSPTSITAMFPAPPSGAPGTVDVVVTEAGGASLGQPDDQFTWMPADVPDAPTGVTAAAGTASALVSFASPAGNGSPISGYTAIATDLTTAGNGGQTGGGASSPITVAGLSNGDSYTFTVTATNGVGTGPSSSPSSAVTPTDVPAAPTGVTATAGAASALVWFTGAASNGGPIIGYTVTATDHSTAGNGGQTGSGASSPVAVSGLTNGDSYTFTVTATNGVGTGPSSSPSNAVTPVDVPAAPAGVTATAGAASAKVSFTSAASNGSPITAYTVTATDHTTAGNGGETGSGLSSPITDSGLTNGDSYTFTVTATNGRGTGPSSSPSSAVTPRAPPTITTTKLPWGVVGTPQTVGLTATGGAPPYTWSLAAGSLLPPGLTLTSTGVISGTPTVAATTTFKVRLQDAAKPANVVTGKVTLTVYAAAASGAGTATIGPAIVRVGTSGNVFTFHYTAPATGAIQGGTVQIVVPTGWTAPSTNAADPGFIRGSQGVFTVSNQVVTIAGIALVPGQSLTVAYGSLANGNRGVTVAATAGSYVFLTSEASRSGTLTALASSPAVTLRRAATLA
jgi:hypothetical protein